MPKAQRSYRDVAVHERITHPGDGHTMRVQSGVATKEQIISAVRKAMDQASQKTGRDYQYEIIVNLLYKEKQQISYSYVWVSNTEVFNLLLGLHPNGKNRSRLEQDPEWHEDPSMIKDIWADVEEPRYIVVEDPPYYEPITYVLDQRQKEFYPLQRKADAEHYEEKLTPADLIAPDVLPLKFKMATIKPTKATIEQNILVTYLPEDISEKKLLEELKRFSHSEGYPTIKVSPRRVAFVTFASNSKDASYALLMITKFLMKGERGQNHLLSFSYYDREKQRREP